MSLLADALQPMFVRGLHSAYGPYEQISLSDVITSPKSAYSISFDNPSKRMNLEFVDHQYVANVVASDCRRLSTSSLQSIAIPSLNEDEKSALPWSLVRLYYAAFYAGHVVVRILGEGCCWLEASHITRLTALMGLFGVAAPTFRLDPGAYRCAVAATGRVLGWTKVGASTRGGAHEALWATLESTMRTAADRTVTGVLPAADAQAVIAKIEEFRSLAVAHNSPSWLSRTRNDLQYRLSHDVWHATSLTKKERTQLTSLSQLWLSDPMTIDLQGSAKYGQLGQFSVACAFVIALFRVLMLRLELLGDGRSFVKHGPRAFANFSKLRLI
jgi:hypothetical protein